MIVAYGYGRKTSWGGLIPSFGYGRAPLVLIVESAYLEDRPALDRFSDREVLDRLASRTAIIFNADTNHVRN